MTTTTTQPFTLAADELSKLVKEFVKLDGNKDGKVSVTQLSKAVKVDNQEHLLQLLQQLDKDNDGQVDIFEFAGLVLHKQDIDREKKLAIVFDIFDSDHNGIIDKNELRNVFKVMLYDDQNVRFLELVCSELYEKMVSDLEEDLPEKLTLSRFSEEFSANIDQIIDNIKQRESDKLKQIDDVKLAKVFNIIDEDNSGFIDKQELRKAFFMMIGMRNASNDDEDEEIQSAEHSGNEELSDKQKVFLDLVKKNVDMWLQKSDENHDGKISQDEFKKFFSEAGADLILQFNEQELSCDSNCAAAEYFFRD